MPAAARPCLEQLFAPHPAERFLSGAWPAAPFSCHGSLERLTELVELPELFDQERLLQAYRDPVMAALPDKRDEHSVLRVDAAAAGDLYQSGLALIFDAAERSFPTLDRWLHQLRVELGLPPGCVARCILYASPPGAGNSPHFDANANFVVQLKGTKRWSLAPNTSVAFPTDRWAMNMGPPSPELASYLTEALPTGLPADAEVIDLQPGSVLFVPRGYWHATDAVGDTLALNFTYSQPTWADVVCAALRQQLLKSDQWRQLADGLGSRDPERSAACCAQLAAMLHQLPGELFELEARKIVESSELP
jgi:50S ribosomal protein L16 3-hydroxylase